MDRSFEIDNDKLLAGLSYIQGYDDETLFAGVRADVLAKSHSTALLMPGHESTTLLNNDDDETCETPACAKTFVLKLAIICFIVTTVFVGVLLSRGKCSFMW